MQDIRNMDYLKYFSLEEYLFKEVTKKFHRSGSLDAFDFFCIVIWKANRAKTKIAKKLYEISGSDNLNEICNLVTSEIFRLKTKEDKLMYLLEKWKFRLPMASAILTVLYPEDFTIYDTRVCKVLGKYQNLSSKSKSKEIVKSYFEFLEAVKKEAPLNLELRDKDRYLWGKSFYEGLTNDIDSNFKRHKN